MQIEDARTSLGRILISLQVQDITAQQLASVNHLIESIRSRLSRLISRLADEDVVEEGTIVDPDTFNEHARYDRSGDRQATADQVTSSQDDIDALFGAVPEPAVAAPAEAASQDDIDALFGG